MPEIEGVTFAERANAIRALAMDAVEVANSGHPGMPMGMADVATVLFSDYLKYDPTEPKWPDRDRFVLSAGHGSMLLYALLYLTGYEQPTIDNIRNFRQLSSPCAGHPENYELPGVEATTGPLGQGLAMAVGMGIAERHLNAVYGDDLIDHRTWVIAGDGCLMEGINHEAMGLAGHLGLGRLIVLWDHNSITIDGSTDLSTTEDIKARYIAGGWHVAECDGHDEADIRRAFDEALAVTDRPSLVACKTIIGYGAPDKMGTSATHGSALGAEEVAKARQFLSWTAPPFVIPEPIAEAWKAAGKRSINIRTVWQDRWISSSNKKEFDRQIAGDEIAVDLKAYKAQLITDGKSIATRKSSEMVLGELTAALPEMIGGSADLTGSNNTKTPSTLPLTSDSYGGRYIYYGIREFGMAAAMNGMALHGGVIPYGGTFLVFSDYCRAAIRLSAIQEQRVIYVLTHDSIGLGEDGPTHQPIEQVQSLRMIPNLELFRPCDSIETAECWELALANLATPSVLALTRQNLPLLRNDASQNLSAKGAYRIRSAQAARKVVLIATGSEVSLAYGVADVLEAQGVGADVVSMPSMSRFDAQPDAYRADLVPEDALLVSIEAGTTFGWERVVGKRGLRFGIDTYGASAPAEVLFEHFGLTPDKIAPQIVAALN